MLLLWVMHPKGADGIANSTDPDQTAPSGAVCSWSTLYTPFMSVWKLINLFPVKSHSRTIWHCRQYARIKLDLSFQNFCIALSRSMITMGLMLGFINPFLTRTLLENKFLVTEDFSEKQFYDFQNMLI